MNINKTVMVAMLVALGFQRAAEWDDEKLKTKIASIPNAVPPRDVPEKYKAIYDDIAKSGGKDIELVEDAKSAKGDKPAPEKAKPAATKPEKAREAKPAPKAAAKKDAKPAKGKPAGRSSSSSSAKTAKPAAKSKPAKGKAAKGDKPKKKEKFIKSARSSVPEDGFGAHFGTIRNAIHNVLTGEWQTDEQIRDKSKVTLRQARWRCHRLCKRGLMERRVHIEYRLTKEGVEAQKKPKDAKPKS